MNAEQYLSTHWGPRHVWTHLKNKKHQTRLRRCAELLEGSKFCDIGCAYGHSTEIMRGFRPGNWTGIEFSADAVREAMENFPAGRWINAGDTAGLARITALEKWDSIVCSEVIEHVPEDAPFVKAVMSAAEQKAVFSTPSVKVRDPGHLRVHTEASLHNLFKPWDHFIYPENPFFYIVVLPERSET
jgi:2-polyprenyl-3-methyl-5-hydroxy-6-metoxy-1,4-benzoquinol methylase